MDDWATAASLATAAGTLVLAVATFASVRSSNRSAQATERALLAGIKPVLLPSRMEDPSQKIGFVDGHWMHVPGGRGVADVTAEAIYLGVGIRNVGNGLAVLDRWNVHVDPRIDPRNGPTPRDLSRPDVSGYRRLTRDLYVAAGDVGFWQGALRDPDDPAFITLRSAIGDRNRITIDLLYGDHEGGQRTVSRFMLVPHGEQDWLASVAYHWNLDRSDPRH
jgi:hypothetical protein